MGTRTSGSEGGGEQTTAHKRGTASRLRPYIEIVRHTQRNVKRWRDGDMRKRWTAAGILEAEQQFRRVIAYRDLAKLAIAVERDLTARTGLVTDPVGRYARHRLTITPGPSSRSSTTNGTSSGPRRPSG